MNLFVAGCSTTWTSRAVSCYLIDKHILFDCGEGTIKNIFKYYGEDVVNGIDYIFLTHFHSDHMFGITPYIAKLVNGKGESNHKLTIVGNRGLRAVLEFMVPNHISGKSVDLDKYLNIIEIEDFSKEINVDNYTIRPFKLNHGVIEDVGYAIHTLDGTLGYTGDAVFDENLINFACKCDVLLCDTSGEKNNFSHNGVEGYHLLEKKFPILQLYAVHCSQKVYESAKDYNINVIEELNEYVFKNGKLIKLTNYN